MLTMPTTAPARNTLNPVVSPHVDHLRALEAESIHIIREVVAEFERPVMLYSIGKDSSVMLRLAQKAFHPGPIPFPLLHVDTTYKFREMIEFRNWYAAEDRRTIDRSHQRRGDCRRHAALPGGDAALLRTLEDQVASRRSGGGQFRRRLRRRSARRGAIACQGTDLLPARREGPMGSQEPAAGTVEPSERAGRTGESIRVFPLSNWTEIDVWQYIHVEQIPVVPLYFAKEREVVVRGNSLIVLEQPFVPLLPGEQPELVKCRMRSLGCSPCTGAVRSDADTVPKIIEELIAVRHSERQLRVIDHDQDGSMELKKREGYF